MSAVSRGYMTPVEGSVSVTPWSVLLNDSEVIEDVTEVRDWDYGSRLRLTRTLHADPERIREQAGLSPGERLAATVAWQSTWTKLRGALHPIELEHGQTDLEVELDSSLLGRDLLLDTRVIAYPDARPRTGIVAHRPGSLLWSRSDRLALEGRGARFPLLPTEFSKSYLAGGRSGLWDLSVESDDLSASALGVMRLYINVEHERARSLLAPELTADARALQAFLRYDVARQLLALALRHDDLMLDDSYPEGSIGAVLVQLVRLLDRPLSELRVLYRDAPGDVEAEFQSAVGYLDEAAA